jgi:hypothetical protein
MAKRNYSASPSLPTGEGGTNSPELVPPKPAESNTGIKLLRQGRRKVSVMPKHVSPPKDEHGRFLPSKKTAKKPLAMAKKTAPALVKRHTITTPKVTPKVRRPPKRTAVARHIQAAGSNVRESYSDMMIGRAKLW